MEKNNLETRGGWNRYDFNVNFFQKWSKKMAYILGFLCADGNIIDSENSSRTRYVQFASKDKKILEKIRKALNSNHPIRIRSSQKKLFPNGKYYTFSKTFYFRIGNKKLVSQLEKLGVPARKSKIIKFLKVPSLYLNHFVRGYFDGDGTVYVEKRKNSKGKIRIKRMRTIFSSGSRAFLEGFSEIIAKFLRIRKAKVYKGVRSFQIAYSLKESIRIFKFMYSNAQRMFLKRKFEKFKEFFKIRKNQLDGEIIKILSENKA
jgi:intein/homing endonuclease